MLAALTASCDKGESLSSLPTDITPDLKFTKLELIEATYNSATIRVQHNGTQADRWYGFVTDNIAASDAVLIQGKIDELTKDGKITGLDKRTSARIVLNGLKPDKKYRYIVFAITEDGQLYGSLASLTFETEESSFLLSQCEDWSVTRDSREASENKEIYSIVFNNTSATRCHVGFIPKWMVEYYENDSNIQAEIEEYGGIRLKIGEVTFLFSILDYLVWEELYEYWGYYEDDDNYFQNETFGESYTFSIPRQASGDYYVVAIGFENGEPTLKYSVSEVTIDKETPSADYNKWIGTWTAKGSNNITYTLNIGENDPNYSYYVYGWECSDSIHDDDCPEDCTEHVLYNDFTKFQYGIPFYFNALNGELSIYSTLLGAEPSSDGESGLYWGMFGYTELEGKKGAILTPEDKIASAALPVGAEATLNGLKSVTYKYGVDGSVEELNFTYNSLGYIKYDDKTYDPVPWNMPLDLPITLTKTSDIPEIPGQSAAVLAEKQEQRAKESFKSVKRKTYNKAL